MAECHGEHEFHAHASRKLFDFLPLMQIETLQIRLV